MSKTMIIPDVGMDPINLNVNTKAYGPYKAGETAEVPAPAAAMLEQMAEAYRKENPSDPDAAPATVGDVKQMISGSSAPTYEVVAEATLGEMQQGGAAVANMWFGESGTISSTEAEAFATALENGETLFFNSSDEPLTATDQEVFVFNVQLDPFEMTGSPARAVGLNHESKDVYSLAVYSSEDLSGKAVRILRQSTEKSDDAVATVGDVKRLIGDSGAGKWIVNFTTDTEAEQTIQCDKTPAEILAAQNTGKIVVGRFQIGAYMVEAPLVEYGSALLTFGALAGKISYTATWKGDGWEVRMVELATA